MTSKKFIFALAMLQAVVQVQGEIFLDGQEDENASALGNEEDSELAVSMEDLINEANAVDIHQRRYFSKDEYHAKCASEKLELLWQMLTEDNSGPKDYMWKEADKFFVQKSNGPFCDASDELRTRREKTTHTQGIVAKVELDVTNRRFTGQYRTGTETAILRFSQTLNLHDDSQGLLPSVAIKMLINGQKSENLFGMPSFESFTGDGAWDFFRDTFKSRVQRFPEEPTNDASTNNCMRRSKEEKMLEGSNFPYATSVVRPAFLYNTGSAVDGSCSVEAPADKTAMRDPDLYQFPFQLEYEGVPYYDQAVNANLPWHEAMRAHFNNQCTDQQGNGDCDNRVKVMDVYGWTAPEGELDLNNQERERVKIGEIKLLSKLTTSKAGDDRLFFQHVRMNKDRRVWPRAWKDANTDFIGVRDTAVFDGISGMERRDDNWPWPKNDDDAAKNMYQALENSGCPFSWLF